MNTLARDIMSTEIITVKTGTLMEDALKLLVNSKITGIPVTDDEGKMVGVFSDYDVIAQISATNDSKPEIFKKPIQYTSTVKSISETTPLNEILDLIINGRYRRLPVLNRDGKLVGIITRRDLMKLFYYRMTLT